jgi:ABC-2 type transport system permease protein
VILILLFGAIFSGNSSGTITVYVQNQDTGPVSTSFVQALNGTGINGTWPISVELVSASENFTRYLAQHSASDGVIIPANFSLDYHYGIPFNVTVYGNPTQSSSAIVSGTVTGVINAFNLRYYNGTVPVIGVTQTTVNTQQTKYVDFLIPGLIGFSVLISPMFSLVSISSEYKKSKLFKQLSLTPLTKMEWLASKVLWYIFLSTLSFLLMVSVGIFVWNANITLTVWLIPFLILGPMLFSSMGMLVGTLTKNPETASVIGNVISFPMMFLSGTFFPMSLYPQYLQTFAHVLPLFYITEGLNAVMVYANYAQAAVDIAVIAVITVILFVAAAKVFKWRE